MVPHILCLDPATVLSSTSLSRHVWAVIATSTSLIQQGQSSGASRAPASSSGASRAPASWHLRRALLALRHLHRTLLALRHGSALGATVGTTLGPLLGSTLGATVGTSLGQPLGSTLGATVGASLGPPFGSTLSGRHRALLVLRHALLARGLVTIGLWAGPSLLLGFLTVQNMTKHGGHPHSVPSSCACSHVACSMTCNSYTGCKPSLQLDHHPGAW
jgi:hypothetical protein